MQTTDKIENDFIIYWKEDGILFSAFKISTVMTLDVIQTSIQMRHAISNNEKQYWCSDFSNLRSFTKEARDYAEVHGQEFLCATAVIINSHITKFILNTFMRLKRADIPLQAFTSRTEAVKWLKSQKNK